jgi:hypothetical protein
MKRMSVFWMITGLAAIVEAIAGSCLSIRVPMLCARLFLRMFSGHSGISMAEPGMVCYQQ